MKNKKPDDLEIARGIIKILCDVETEFGLGAEVLLHALQILHIEPKEFHRLVYDGCIEWDC